MLLHDHLDGGLRPGTVAELADRLRYDDLPHCDRAELARWFHHNSPGASLVDYLVKFDHTIAVMRDADALVRVASEAVQDVAADNVVYAEFRYAPSLLVAPNLPMEAVVEAVSQGLVDGMAAAASQGHHIVASSLLTAMRHTDDWMPTARLAASGYPQVSGFDIAGPEDGFPASRGHATFAWLRNRNVHLTVHAGEAFGLPAIADAVHTCGAERLGHGVRLADDITVDGDGGVRLGPLAAYLRDRRIPLELCPSSNVHTSAVASAASHPFDLLYRAELRVTVNTDNRLMSNVSLSGEFARLCAQFGYTLDDVGRLTLNAAKAAFIDYETRTSLIRDVLLPRFAALGAHL